MVITQPIYRPAPDAWVRFLSVSELGSASGNLRERGAQCEHHAFRQFLLRCARENSAKWRGELQYSDQRSTVSSSTLTA